VPNHLTIRMAWHDNNWNGTICEKPKENIYCIGNHSLLSERLARNRRLPIEKRNHGKKIDALGTYLPPCFWSSNAFSKRACKVGHDHPFLDDRGVKPINDNVAAYSVLSWPFRLSFNHSKDKQETEGKYPSDLVQRIDNFRRKFQKGKSMMFFYLNYDNPISADEEQMKYVLLGCSLLSEDIDMPKNYRIGDQLMQDTKDGQGMQNFNPMLWALQFRHDYKNFGIVLPYKQYLEFIEKHPEKEDIIRDQLNELRILIEEDSLIFSFKYVAAELDDDQCLYLLYRIKKAIDLVQKHGIVNFSREEKIIEKLINKAWKNRGLYPSLPRIIDIIADVTQDEKLGQELLSKVQKNISRKQDLLEIVFNQLLNQEASIPAYLSSFRSRIKELRINISDYRSAKIDLLKKLSLFSLTRQQLKRIIDGHPFKKQVDPLDIVHNPYLLCENYVPEDPDLDDQDISDGPIDVFKIDVGMFPDAKCLERNERLQNLTARSPERLRAIIVGYLYYIGENQGHCYSALDRLYDYVISWPLFYKKELNIDPDELCAKSGKYHEHFKERLEIKPNQGKFYFYLKEVLFAENLIRNVITKLIDEKDHEFAIENLDRYVEEQKDDLKRIIPSFDEKQFVEERTKLLKTVLRKSFYVITGRPGSGKTRALGKIIEEIVLVQGEDLTLLAPTGKATLRVKKLVEQSCPQLRKRIDPYTIDRYIWENSDYRNYLENFENILLEKNKKKVKIVNMIIDECSMVDLQKLATLFLMFETQGAERIKRIILVGDENQLPPIGFGRPFYDIVQFLKSRRELHEKHFIKLMTNCRQKYDTKILELSEIFVGKNKYYEELLEHLSKDGDISDGLAVEHWRDEKELQDKISKRISTIIDTEKVEMLKNKEISKEELSKYVTEEQKLNLLLGLYANGHVPRDPNSERKMDLDRFQVLTPYRAGYFGVLGINPWIKQQYRKEKHWLDAQYFDKYKPSIFSHADKIIRVTNWYKYTGYGKKLRLSNGSIGIINNKRGLKPPRLYYFSDQEEPLSKIDDEDNFELAYAITIHKSQGSEFKNVFLVIPKKRALLSKEVLYTAFTRSTHRVTLFLQKEDEDALKIARNRSFVLLRNTSIFEQPQDWEKIFWPERGLGVRSKIEYILYTALKSNGLDFKYEEPLKVKGRTKPIHPDFTIDVNEKKYYWEHLGELDLRYYSKEYWEEKRKEYESSGLLDYLITTDDLNGVEADEISKIIKDIKRNKLDGSPDCKYSKHHYQLYSH